MFIHNYNKIISVVYLQTEKTSFIGKGSELYFNFLKAKYYTFKPYSPNIAVDNKIPEEDIKKIIK